MQLESGWWICNWIAKREKNEMLVSGAGWIISQEDFNLDGLEIP